MAQNLDTRGSNSPKVYRDTGLTNTAVSASTSASELTGWNIINVNTSDVYIKFYDIASAGSVVVGTTTIVKTLLIPASSTVYLEHDKDNTQYCFVNGIGLSCVTGLADNSTTAPTTAIYVEIYFKTA